MPSENASKIHQPTLASLRMLSQAFQDVFPAGLDGSRVIARDLELLLEDLS